MKLTRLSFQNTLIIREMQIKTTMRYHLAAVRKAIIKNSTNNKCWRQCGEADTFLHCWWNGKLVQPLWKIVWRFFIKLKIELPYESAISPLGMYPEKSLSEKITCTFAHSSTTHSSQDIETT